MGCFSAKIKCTGVTWGNGSTDLNWYFWKAGVLNGNFNKNNYKNKK